MSLKPTGINSTLFPKKDKKHVEDAGAPVARDLSDGGDSDTLQIGRASCRERGS